MTCTVCLLNAMDSLESSLHLELPCDKRRTRTVHYSAQLRCCRPSHSARFDGTQTEWQGLIIFCDVRSLLFRFYNDIYLPCTKNDERLRFHRCVSVHSWMVVPWLLVQGPFPTSVPMSCLERVYPSLVIGPAQEV